MPSSIFTSDDAAIGFVVVLICFFASESIGTMISRIRRGGARVERTRSLGNVVSNIMVFFAWMTVLVFSVVIAKAGLGLLPGWVYCVGIAVMLGGIALRQWAIAVLGGYFSSVIGVQKEQKVVESGPYRLIRHPSYTGALIFYVGMGLAVQSWAAVLIGIAIFSLVYGYRILLEEKALISQLGNNYVEYMKRTKRVIPYMI